MKSSGPEHVLRKIHHCTFWPKISQRPFFGFQPKKFHLIIYKKILMTYFSHQPFFIISSLLFRGFRFKDFSENLSSYLSKKLMTFFLFAFFSHRPFYTHLHPIFPFIHLTFCSRNNKCYVRLLLFSEFITARTALHHCTFCASLHVKTSPAYNKERHSKMRILRRPKHTQHDHLLAFVQTN